MTRHAFFATATLATLLVATAHPVSGQSAPPPRSPDGVEVRSGSPYQTALGPDVLLLGVGLGGSALATSMGGTRTDLSEDLAARLRPENVAWFDRSATSRYSPELVGTSEDVASVLAYAPLGLLLDARARSDWATLALMYAQTSLLSSAAANLTKESVHRYRPYVYNAGLSYEQKTAKDPGGAFFSSAATYAFARAVFISTVFSDYNPNSRLKPLVWAGTLGTAAAVGYLRYESGLHYPSDVVVAALVGSAIGYAVPRLHRTGNRSVSVAPAATDDGLGVGMTLRF